MYVVIYKSKKQSAWKAYSDLFKTREDAQQYGDRVVAAGTYMIRVLYLDIEA